MEQSFVDPETWKIIVEGAKRNKHVILSNGASGKSYGFLISERNNPLTKTNCYPSFDEASCFRCNKQSKLYYYEWIHPEELKVEKV